MEYTKWEVSTISIGKRSGILKNWGYDAGKWYKYTYQSDSVSSPYVGEHKPLFTFIKVFFQFTGITYWGSHCKALETDKKINSW